MNGDPQKRKVLYEALTKDGYALGTLDEFSSKMDDPNKAKALYDGITKDGYQVGDFETFNAKVGSPKPAALSSMTTPLPGAAAGPSTGSGMQQGVPQTPSPAQQPPSVQDTQQVAGLPESVEPIRLDEAGDQIVDMPAEFLTKSRQREAWRTVTSAPDKPARDAAMAQIKADRAVRSKMDRVFAQKQEDRRLVDEQVSRDLQFSLPPQEVPSGLPEGQGPTTSMLDPREQKVRADYMNSLTPEQQAYRASKQDAGQWVDRDAFDEDVSSLTHAMNVLDARERRLLRKSEFRKAQQQTDAAGDVLFQDNSDVMAEAQDIDLGKQYVIERLQTAVRRHPEYASEELVRKAKTFQADVGAIVNPAAYSVAQPILFAIDKFAASILTTPRSFGGAEYGKTDQLAEWAERSMENIRANEPTKFRGSIIEEGGAVNPERILPKVVETIAQAALLMGTSPTRPALLASSFVQTNGDYYKEATTRGLTHDQAKAFAWSAAALTSALEMASPNDAARQMVAGTLRKEIAAGLEQGLTTKEILKRASAAAGKEVLPEAGQEGGQYLGDKGAAYLTNRILGSDNLDDEVKFTEFTENSLLGGVVGGLSGGGTEAMRLASIQETAANPQKVAEAAKAMGDEKAAEKVQRIVNTYEANGLPKVAPEKAAMAADAIIRKDDLKERIAQAPMDPAIEAVSGDPRRSEEIALTAKAMIAMGIEPSKAAMALAGQGMLNIPEGAKVKKMADGTVDIEVKEPKEGEEGVSKKEVQADLAKQVESILKATFTEEATGVDEEPTAAPTGVPEGGVPVSTEAAIPAAPSTSPVPDGFVRRFHVTGLENADGIRANGISMSKAKGVEGPKAIYGWPTYEEAKNYAGGSDAAIVEYLVPKEQADRNPVSSVGDIAPDKIMAVHEPWHAHYRYAKEEGVSPNEMRGIDEQYDKAANALEAELTNEGSTTTTEAPAAQAPEDTGDPAGVPPAPEPAAAEPIAIAAETATPKATLEKMDPTARDLAERKDKLGQQKLVKDLTGIQEVLGKVLDLTADIPTVTNGPLDPVAINKKLAKYGASAAFGDTQFQLTVRMPNGGSASFNVLALPNILAEVKKVSKPMSEAPIGGPKKRTMGNFDTVDTAKESLAMAESNLENAKREDNKKLIALFQDQYDKVKKLHDQKVAAEEARVRYEAELAKNELDTATFEAKSREEKERRKFETQQTNYEFEERQKELSKNLTEEDRMDGVYRDKTQFGDKLTPEELAYVNENYFRPEGYDFDENGGLVQAAAQQTSIDQAPAKEATKVRLHGNVYDLVEERPDGTATLRNDQGDEFDTDASETYTKLASVEKPIASDKEVGTKKQFVQKELDGLRQRRKAAYDDAVRAAESLVPSDTKIPVGITKLTWLNSRPRPSKEQRAALTKVRVAEDNLNADTRSDAENYGRVYDKLQAPAQAEAPLPKKEETTYEAKARKAAAALEKAKLKPDQLYALPLPPSVWNGAIRAMQEVIIAGGKAADAIAAAIKHIQNSDWWKNKATQKEKDEVIASVQSRQSELAKSLGEEEPAPKAEEPPPAAPKAAKEPSEPKEVKKTFTTVRAYEGDFREEVKAELAKGGLYRDIENQEEAEERADAFIAKVGIDAALQAARTGDVRGGARSVIVVRALEDLDRQYMKAKTPERMAEVLAETAELIQWRDRTFTEIGRETSMMARMYEKSDLGFTVAARTSDWKKKTGEEPTEDQIKRWKEVEAEMNVWKEKYAEAEKRAEEAQAAATLKAIQDSVTRQKAANRKTTPAQKSKVLADKIRTLKISQPGALRSTTMVPELWNASVEVVAQTVQAGGNLATAIQIGLNKIRESEWYKKLKQKEQEEAETSFSSTIEDAMADDVEVGPLRIPKQMIRDAVEAGAKDIDSLVAVIKGQIKEEYPDATDRQIRDAITEYGKVVNLNKDELSVEVRRIKRIGRIVSALEDVANKIRPLRSGLQRDKLDAEERALNKELREALKDLPVDAEAQARELRTALDAAKTRARNRIEDLQREIDTKQRTPRSTTRVEPDAELEALIAEKEELEKEHDAIFGDKSLTAEERLKRAIDSTRRSVEALDQKIRDKNVDPAKPATVPETPELKALRERRAKLREEYRKMQEEAGVIDRRRLDTAKKVAKARIQELERRIDQGDFSKKEAKPPVLDNELIQLQAEKMRLKEEYDKELYKHKLLNRTMPERVKDSLWEFWGLTRALRATGELSFVLIQGGSLTISNMWHKPGAVGRAFKAMWQAMRSEKKSEEWLRKVKSQTWYPIAKEAKLAITEPHAELSAREELFMSDWLKIIWNVLGSPLKPISKKAYEAWTKANPARVIERGASAYLDTLRIERFMDGMAMLEKNTGNSPSKEELKDIADVANTLTGRASIGKLEPIASTLTKLFFSPRLWASAIKTGTPYAFIHFGKMTPTARKMAMQDLGRYIGTTMGLVAMAAAYLNNDDDDETGVETDPRSADFGKIKIGNKYIDPWGGRIQQLVFSTRMTIGALSLIGEGLGKEPLPAYKDRKTGDITPLGQGMTPTMAETAIRMAQNKLAPSAGLLWEAASTKVRKDGTRTSFGKEYDMSEELAGNLYPIYVETVADLAKEDPGALEGFLMFYAFFGGGVNVNAPEEPKERVRPARPERPERPTR